jgi:cystathionine beta-lyase/cystathionine gamma-synthase
MQFKAKVIHAGLEHDISTGAVITPMYLTSTYRQEEVDVHKGF